MAERSPLLWRPSTLGCGASNAHRTGAITAQGGRYPQHLGQDALDALGLEPTSGARPTSPPPSPRSRTWGRPGSTRKRIAGHRARRRLAPWRPRRRSATQKASSVSWPFVWRWGDSNSRPAMSSQGFSERSYRVISDRGRPVAPLPDPSSQDVPATTVSSPVAGKPANDVRPVPTGRGTADARLIT